MLIGHCEIVDKLDDKVIVKIDKEFLVINSTDTMDILSDPFPESPQVGAYIYMQMSFDEFCSNIEDDGDEYIFTDDLMYIGGIAKY